MIFSSPLPWLPHDLNRFEKFLEKNQNEDRITLRWWWEPFHAPGLKALKYAAKNNLDAAQLEDVLENLSCPGDEHGALLPLDPTAAIKTTWREASNFAAFGEREAFTPTIGQLRDLLQIRWMPCLYDSPDLAQVSSWLTTLQRFHDLDPWVRLEGIENVLGLTKSSSSLHFQRIYSL